MPEPQRAKAGRWSLKEALGLGLALANLFLLFHLLSGEWDVLEKAKTLLELLLLAGGAGVFAASRRIIARRTGANLLMLGTLVLLNLPLYGSDFSVKPEDTRIYMVGENEEFPPVKHCCLSLKKMELTFVRDPFRPETRSIRAHNLFLSFWGLRPIEVVLKAKYDLWVSQLPATILVDGKTEGLPQQHNMTLLLTPGEHTLICEGANGTETKKIKVPGQSQFIECLRPVGQ